MDSERVLYSGCAAADRATHTCWLDFQDPTRTPIIRLSIDRSVEYVRSSIAIRVGDQVVPPDALSSSDDNETIAEVSIPTPDVTLSLEERTDGSERRRWSLSVRALEFPEDYVAARSRLLLSADGHRAEALESFRASTRDARGLTRVDALATAGYVSHLLSEPNARDAFIREAYETAEGLDSDEAKSVTVKRGGQFIGSLIRQERLSERGSIALDTASAVARRVTPLLARYGDAGTLAIVHLALAKLHHARGSRGRSLLHTEEALRTLPVVGLDLLTNEARKYRLYALAGLGRCQEAAHDAHELEASIPPPSPNSCARERELSNLAWIDLLCSIVHSRPPQPDSRARLQQALSGLRAPGKRCELDRDYTNLLADVVSNLAIFALAEGSLQAATHWLETTSTVTLARYQRRWRPLISAQIHGRRGARDEALAELERANFDGAPGVLRYRVALLRGDLYEASSMPAEALQQYRGAERLLISGGREDAAQAMGGVKPSEPYARQLNVLVKQNRLQEAVETFWRSTRRHREFEYTNSPVERRPAPRAPSTGLAQLLLHPLVASDTDEHTPWLLLCVSAAASVRAQRVDRLPTPTSTLWSAKSWCGEAASPRQVVFAEPAPVDSDTPNVDVWRPRL